MRPLLLALALLSCTSDDPPAGSVRDVCGAPPNPPGWEASFDTVNGEAVAVMSRKDYDAIIAWRDELGAWRDCAADL